MIAWLDRYAVRIWLVLLGADAAYSWWSWRKMRQREQTWAEATR